MIVLRPATKRDYKPLAVLFRDLARAEGYNGWFPKVVFDDFVERARREGGPHPRFYIKVAVDADTGAIAGFARATHRLDGQTTINESFRAREYRNAGINELLYADIVESAAARGSAVVFTKLVDCEPAKKFAEKAGFTNIGTQVPDAGRPGRSAVLLFARTAQPGQALEDCRGRIRTSLPRGYTQKLIF